MRKGQPKRFVNGHGNPSKAPTQPCACGCGRDAGRYSGDGGSSKKGEPKRFLQGHHISPERLQCTKGHLQTPENRLASGYCKLCARIASAKWKEKNPFAERGKHYQTRYGISKEQFEEQCARQENKCAICDVSFDYATRETTPTLDHAHDSTSRFRGVLCITCNSGIGLLKDNVQLLENAIHYLKETQWNQFKASFSATVFAREVVRIPLSILSLNSVDTSMTSSVSVLPTNLSVR
jgi:hypothetical protein